jgi:hypothetical protein
LHTIRKRWYGSTFCPSTYLVDVSIPFRDDIALFKPSNILMGIDFWVCSVSPASVAARGIVEAFTASPAIRLAALAFACCI